MSNESAMKKCCDSGQIGHTSTACNNGKTDIINLFGVKIHPTANQSHEEDGPLQVVNGETYNINEHSSIDLGYTSDEHNQDKNKGVPWTEDEHRSFLKGLEQLGKGRWRAISKHHVPSRTPTQVASHAQKFFIRKNSTEDKRKRRSSLFDMPFDEYSTTLGASVRPPVARMARTYGVEGYTRFSNMINYRNNRIPLTNYMSEESVHPHKRRPGSFATLVSQPLLITNGERWSKQEPEIERTKD